LPLAGAVAYYALLSIVPLLILIAIVLTQWIDPEMLLQALHVISVAGPRRVAVVGRARQFPRNGQVVGGCYSAP
jgi:uncharacterized BrkB/YihY/UPF0761 family membrane protein